VTHRLKTIFLALAGRERSIFFIALFFLAASLLAESCFFIRKHTQVVPTIGGEYNEGVVGQPTYINPILAASETDKNLVRLLFSNVPDIADKIEIDKNGRIWKIRIKEGIVWADGKKLTSDDVIFTVERIQAPESQSPYFLAWQGVNVSRLSELELQFNLVSPYPFFLEHLKHLYIVPKRLFAETPSANWRLSEYNLKPLGSGPYIFESYEKQPNGFITTYRLKTNPRYFGKHPLIQNIIFRFYSKTSDLVNAFNTGAIDGFTEIDPAALLQINRPHNIISFALPNYYAVFWNQGQNLALKERDVRQALSLAIDRGALVKLAFADQASVAANPLTTVNPSDPKNYDFLYSPTEAAELLEQNGWKIGENGFREKNIKNTPLRLEFGLVVPQIPFLTATAGYLEKAWRAIGAKINVISLPTEEVVERTIRNREYQTILFGNTLNPRNDLYAFWHSNERFYPGLNLSLYSNKQADKLMESIRANFDEQSREKELSELKEVIANDYPAAFLYSPYYLFVATKELNGVVSGSLAEPADRLSQISEWYMRTTRTFK